MFLGRELEIMIEDGLFYLFYFQKCIREQERTPEKRHNKERGA